MSSLKRTPDWDPRSAGAHSLVAGDEMRKKCPVAYGGAAYGWSVFKYADLLRILKDHRTFSNLVSKHPSVPNGLDPPMHTAYRRIIDPYFSAAEMGAFEPTCRRLALQRSKKLWALPRVEVMNEFAHPFALDVQCAFVGWPHGEREALQGWLVRKERATAAQDRSELSRIAGEFAGFIEQMLADDRDENVAKRLSREQFDGRSLNTAEITSILRNWTVGELGSIAASLGIVLAFLGRDRELQARLRDKPELLPPAIDEILRLQGPLLSNRRRVTEVTELGGRQLQVGELVTLHWTAANRDDEVFAEPQQFRLNRPQQSLLYGAGIHACPGAPLARLELRLALESLLASCDEFKLEGVPEVAAYPAAGFSEVYLSR